MTSEIFDYIKNYFSKKEDKIFGNFTVKDGTLSPSFRIQKGQYYRIIGSVFNDGVHREGDMLVDEESFRGAVWLMRVPKEVEALISDIEAWQSQHGAVDSVNMSPYKSESFGGYSYTKNSDSGSAVTWKEAFAERLSQYRRIRTV